MPAAILGWGICDAYPCMLFGDPAGHSVCIEWADKYTCHMQLWVDSATFAFFLAAWLRGHKIHCQNKNSIKEVDDWQA